MRWAKFILLFQAIITLVLGIVFFAQVLSLDIAKVSEYRMEVDSGNLSQGQQAEFVDLKARYSAASYVLLFVSLLELIIILKLLT